MVTTDTRSPKPIRSSPGPECPLHAALCGPIWHQSWVVPLCPHSTVWEAGTGMSLQAGVDKQDWTSQLSVWATAKLAGDRRHQGAQSESLRHQEWGRGGGGGPLHLLQKPQVWRGGGAATSPCRHWSRSRVCTWHGTPTLRQLCPWLSLWPIKRGTWGHFLSFSTHSCYKVNVFQPRTWQHVPQAPTLRLPVLTQSCLLPALPALLPSPL